MERQSETVWSDGAGTTLLRQNETNLDRWLVYPSGCDAETLAELGKAIIDALDDTKEGADLLEFAHDTISRKRYVVDEEPAPDSGEAEAVEEEA